MPGRVWPDAPAWRRVVGHDREAEAPPDRTAPVSRRRDAALALSVLLPVLAVGTTFGAPADPLAAAVGVGGALLGEAALSWRRALVRRVWERRAVQAGAATLALGGGAVGTLTVGTRALTALAAGLTAYLGLLAVVTVHERRRLTPSSARTLLRRRAALLAVAAAVGTTGVGGALAATRWTGATRWTLAALGVLVAEFVVLGRNLDANRTVGGTLRGRLGAANAATLARGVLIAWLAGFAVVPWDGALAPVPAALYGTAVALDTVDGVLARRVGQVTTLGARLDDAVDGLGLFAGLAVAAAAGALAAPLVLLGAVKYAYLAAVWRRRRRGGSLRLLPTRGSRRLLAVLQMLAVVVALAPPVTAGVAGVVVVAAGGVYCLGFVRDWRLRVR